MSLVTCQLSMSLDGFVAGPEQSMDNPLGRGGMRLHEWAFATSSWQEQHGIIGGEDNQDAQVLAELNEGIGAYIMGRNMFGPGRGAWDESWTGWWGEEPPYHAPVFVLTNHPREPLEMKGGTTFTFVTAGVEAALDLARTAATADRISIAGGASTAAQFLAAGLLDELHLHVVPILLGAGERLFDGAGHPTLEPAGVIASPTVTHLRYRVTT